MRAPRARVTLASALAFALLCAGCATPPAPQLPDSGAAERYKELSAEADAGESQAPSNWWVLFQDEELTRLQDRLLGMSPDLASALARYDAALASSAGIRAAQSPTLGASLDVQRLRQSDRRPLRGASSPDLYNSGTLGLDLQYELDLWGRVRRQVEAGDAMALAANADLAGAKLALQAQLADTYIALRGVDQDLALFKRAEAAYTKALELVRNRHDGGLSSGLDMARAEAQLESTRSQARQQQARRAGLEHAIAALVGDNPSSFRLPAREDAVALPNVPPGLPSELLQRRPDIAGSRHRVTAANATLGVAKTAFFPSLTLGLQGGLQSGDLSRFIEAPNLFWAVGPSLVASLLDGGRRQANEDRARAQLEEATQSYRAVVLGAFQQVEDQLALITDFGTAAQAEARAAFAAQRALDMAQNRYREGAASYLEVVTAQTVQLQAQRSLVDLATRQRRASVQLIRALGGGWTEPGIAQSKLPTRSAS